MIMNTTCCAARRLSVVLTAFFTIHLAIVAAAAEVPQAIHIIQVKGQARYSSDYKKWQQLKAGDVIGPGALLQTAEKSTVDLFVSDRELPPGPTPAALDASAKAPLAGPQRENVMHLTANSVLGIDKLLRDQDGAVEASEIQLDLRDGQVIGRFGQPSPGSKFEIKFNRGVAGVRQGVYAINATGAVRVSSGAVIVAETLDGSSLVTKMVAANQMFDPRTGTVTQVAPGEIKSPQSDSQPPTERLPRPAVAGPDFGQPLRKF
jgi:hypothetical protein